MFSHIVLVYMYINRRLHMDVEYSVYCCPMLGSRVALSFGVNDSMENPTAVHEHSECHNILMHVDLYQQIYMVIYIYVCWRLRKLLEWRHPLQSGIIYSI